jgi:hypothetical protein
MSVPIYIVALVLVIIVAQVSDRIEHRFAFILVAVSLGIIGYSILLAPGLPYGIKYMAIYFSAAGFYIGHPLIMIWAVNNWAGHYKRSFGTAIVSGVGNAGGFVASNIYPPGDAPKFIRGFGITLAGVVLTGLMSIVFFFGLRLENRKRRTGMRNHRKNLPVGELENLGDGHPDFRFIY